MLDWANTLFGEISRDPYTACINNGEYLTSTQPILSSAVDADRTDESFPFSLLENISTQPTQWLFITNYLNNLAKPLVSNQIFLLLENHIIVLITPFFSSSPHNSSPPKIQLYFPIILNTSTNTANKPNNNTRKTSIFHYL